MRRFLVIPFVLSLLGPTVASAQIVNTLRGFEDQELAWSGGLEGTVAATEGNTDYFEYELTATVQHLSERNRWRLIGRWMDRRSESVSIAKNRLGHLRHNYRLADRFATLAFVQGAHNPFQRLETRLLAGAGLRLDVIRAKSWNGAIGAAYMYEDQEIGPLPDGAPPGPEDDSGHEVSHRASLFLSLFTVEHETVEADLVVFWQPVLNDASDSRTFATASVRVGVKGGLYVLARYHLTWDTTPAIGVKERDQAIRGGLGFEF